jgi:hypothetical protein
VYCGLDFFFFATVDSSETDVASSRLDLTILLSIGSHAETEHICRGISASSKRRRECSVRFMVIE